MTSRTANFTNLIFGLSLATGLLCAGANASAQTTASITIPFAFSADHQYVAAGTYGVRVAVGPLLVPSEHRDWQSDSSSDGPAGIGTGH